MTNGEIEIRAPDRGVFILSLDCEGLWGMADNRSVIADGLINEQSLTAAYDFIRSVLTKHDLIATCAFVSAFAAEADLLYDNLDLLERLAELNPSWFHWALAAVKNRRSDGWSGHHLYRFLSSAGHEMAWHGATHLPLCDEASELSVLLEIELAERIWVQRGEKPRTLVFPRNKIGHLRTLRRAGFETYRDGPRRSVTGRILAFAGEANPASRCDTCVPRTLDGWRVCGPGAFLNWPSGPRKLVPVSVTIRKWKSMLHDAVNRGGIVHMWFHPHNLITVPEMKESFAEIIQYAGELTRRSDLLNLTIARSVAHLNCNIKGSD